MRRFAFFVLIVACLCSCKRASQTQETTQRSSDNIFKYAKNIYCHPGSDTVYVYCTWNDSKDTLVYCLRDIKSNSIAVISTTDIAMLAELGATDQITGICDPFRTTNPKVQERLKQGLVQNVGTSMETNIEALVALNPDLVITSAYNSLDLKKYQHVSCPIVFTTSWQENTPLARIEWIKFVGMLIGKTHEADSVFAEIEKKYLALKSRADSIDTKPLVLAGAASNDIWYMPGGKSYVAQFIADAGGKFIWEDDENTGSVVLNFEQVLHASQNADCWIGCDEKSYAELDAMNKNYKLLDVYKKKAIYNRSKRSFPNGGNDYWEYGYVRPDIVLADYMKIIHPELLPDYETVFLEKLAE
ncbi:MAG: ABC transporter substrate-binding protein [Bacteroidales bacterium]|nr:ABC transporter substrate-binding protein [Bacteroidales bacterium]